MDIEQTARLGRGLPDAGLRVIQIEQHYILHEYGQMFSETGESEGTERVQGQCFGLCGPVLLLLCHHLEETLLEPTDGWLPELVHLASEEGTDSD